MVSGCGAYESHKLSKFKLSSPVCVSGGSGSYECRVGWATNDKPLMTFRNLIAKPRREKAKKDGELPLIQPTQIGNDIVNIEAMRYQLRTQVAVINAINRVLVLE